MSNPLFDNTQRIFREGDSLFGRVSIDKISFRVSNSLLNLDKVKAYQKKGPVTITNAGGAYWDIGFHAEAFVPWLPELPQIGIYLFRLWFEGILSHQLHSLVIPLILPIWDWNDLVLVHCWIESLAKAGFILAENEVAFDFPEKDRPVRLVNRESGHKFRSTLYSNDGVRKKRKVMVNGECRLHSKGNRKDLVAEYNRGKKIDSESFCWRLELRLSRFHLQDFTLWDFMVPFYTRLILRFHTFVKLLKTAVPPGSWSIRSNALTSEMWYLRLLLRSAGWNTH